MSWRLLILYLLFTIEIRVHASQVQLPDNCHAGTSGCTIWYRQAKPRFTWFDKAVAVSNGSIVSWVDANNLRLIKGSVGLDLQEGQRLSTILGEITGQGWLVVERLSKKTRVSCFSGQMSLLPLGFKDPLVLSAGFFVDISSVQEDGLAFVEIPQLLSLPSALTFWWQHYRDGKDKFLVQAKEFLAGANLRAETAGQWQETLANRYIASVWEQRRLAAERKLRAEAEGKKMRALFRKMNYLDE